MDNNNKHPKKKKDVSRQIAYGRYLEWTITVAHMLVDDFAEACRNSGVTAEEALELLEEFWAKNPNVILDEIKREIAEISKDYSEDPPPGLDWSDISFDDQNPYPGSSK